MAIFGLLLIFLGVGLGLASFFGLGYDSDGDRDRQVAIFNNNTTPEMVLLLGVLIGAVILIGLWFMKSGAQRGLARRKERKRYREMSEKLEEVERRDTERTDGGTKPGEPT